MKSATAAPYLLPSETAVVGHAWATEDGSPIGDRFEHWDPHTNLAIVRVMEVDLDAVREGCGLGRDATFALVASWHSSRTRLAGNGEPVELGNAAGLVRVALPLTVPGVDAGGRLDLRTRLVLRAAGGSPSVISPRRVGATLWTDETRVALEGSAARFPITATEFGDGTGLPEEAAWALEWNVDDLDAPVLGGLRLLINAGHPEVLAALRTGSSDPRSSAVRSFVMFDVARSLVEAALSNERFVEDPEVFEVGSVGRLLHELLTLCWPGVPLPALVERNRATPARVAADLQAHLELLR